MKKLPENNPALLLELGTMSDFKVAAKFNIRPYQVKKLRQERNIPSVAEHITKQSYVWTDEAEVLLGTMADTQLASFLGTSRSVVNYRRSQLNITAYKAPELPNSGNSIKPHLWQPDEEKLLGTDYDTSIAQQLNLSPLQISHHRHKLGIDPYWNNKPIIWDKSMLNNLGEISDKDFAEYFEISTTSVYMKRILLSIPAFMQQDPPVIPSIPKAAIKLLGKISDSELAKQFGSNRLYIRINRMLLGLPIAPRKLSINQYQWTFETESLLGTIKDSDLAIKLGIPKKTIAYRRQQLKIATYAYKNKIEWDDLKISLLGHCQDKVLAQKWFCDIQLVSKKRAELGICEHHGKRIWAQQEIDLLGKLSDPNIAQQIGMSSTTVRNMRKQLGIKAKTSSSQLQWSKENIALLGSIHDAVLAYHMKVTPATVTKKRTKMNIPIFKSKHKKHWSIAENRAKLGTMPDSQLAKLLGITTPAIFIKRKQMGIAAFQPNK